jgi:hypothetical protein
MPGKNFRQGYHCKGCVEMKLQNVVKSAPLYKRVNGMYKYAGLVLCSVHGVKEGLPKKEVF